MRIAPRYLLGAVMAALLLQEYVETLRDFLNIPGVWNVPATFLGIVSVYGVLKAIDTLDPDRSAGASRNAFFEAVLLITLMAEFLILLVVAGRFTGADASVVEMAGAMCAYYVVEPVYQAFAILDTVDKAARRRRQFYLIGGAATFALYLTAFWLFPTPIGLLWAQTAATGSYILIWQVHFRAKMRAAHQSPATPQS